jgi:hypothetical protein
LTEVGWACLSASCILHFRPHVVSSFICITRAPDLHC